MASQKPLPAWFVPLLIGSGALALFLGAKKVQEAAR